MSRATSPQAVEAGRALARELGQLPDEMPVVQTQRLGVLVPVQSKSRQGHTYWMAWAPVSGWVHADSSCPSYRECWHRKEAEKIMTSLTVSNPTGVAVAARPVLLVEYNAQALSEGVDPELVAKWAYSLPGGGGQGVSVRGVEEGVRKMASLGEVIRVDSCVLVNQDDYEAFFMASASRYVINPETGQSIQLDSQTRGKRVPKYEDHSETYMREHPNAPRSYFNPKWYEVGVSKAARNAALALMPSNVKSALLKAGLDAQAGGGNSARQSTPRRGGSAPQGTQQNAAPSGANAMTKFWQDAKALKLDNETVIAKSQEWYGNREPIGLNPQERIDLLARLTQEKQGAETPPDHDAVMTYTPSGEPVCETCGQPMDEESGMHKTAQAQLLAT